VRKSLKDHGDKVGGDDKAKIETALKEAEEAIKSDDKDRIEATTQALAQAAQKLAEQVYKDEQAKQQQQAGADAGAGKAENAKKDDDNVVDAEYEEVKDKK
jgi:molecular chaperone DnaK